MVRAPAEVTMLPMVVLLVGAGAGVAAWYVQHRKEQARAEHGEPRWEAYLTEERGQPSAVLVDLHWHRSGGDAHLVQASWVLIDMDHPGRHGVGTAEEADRISVAEQRLLDDLAQEGTIFVGRTRAGGTWRLLFMSPAGANPAVTVSDVLGEAGIHSFRCLSTHDPKWNAYHRCLAPDAERLRWIEDARTFNDLAARGEPVGIERAIAHTVHFDDATASDRFRQLAGLYGFSIAGVEQSNSTITVELVRTDVVDLERVHSVVMELTHLALTCDGQYGGWHCVAAAA